MQQRKRQQGFSLILISKDHRTVRRWEVRRGLVKLVCGVVAGLSVGLAISLTGFVHYWRGYAATEQIRIQNAQYDQERAALHARVAALEESVERADRLVSRLEGSEKIAKKSEITEGIGPISEPAALPAVPVMAGTRELQIGADSHNHTLAFADLEGKVSGLSETARRLEDRLGKVYEVRKQRNSYWSALPTAWPVRGWITSGFGPRRANAAGGTRVHAGIDIAAPFGTPIYASGDGMVTFSGSKGGYGRAIIIDHGFGISTLYAHNSEVHVNEGDRVKRGMLIATVGLTGRTTGSHLHYEVMVDGVPVDPLRYLAGRK